MEQKKIKKIGVLTGGGDCPGLNAVIRAVVKTSEYYGITAYGLYGGFSGFVEEPMMKPLHSKDVSGLLVEGGTILGTYNKGSLLEKSKIGSLNKSELKNEIDRHLDAFKKAEIDAVIAIGGDGTLSIADVLAKNGLNIIGVPKTIDNDVDITETTFGFDTAVATASDAIGKLHTTAESHKRVMVVELMGRYTGWISLHSGIAAGADVILIPEIPFDLDNVYRKIYDRYNGRSKFAIVVVAEGAKPKGMDIFISKERGNIGNPILGGIAEYVSNEIEKRTGKESRSLVLGHLQRGGTPTTFDRLLSTRFGAAAVRAAITGDFGKMVAFKSNEIVHVPIESAVKNMKKVEPDSELVLSARELGISFGDV